jgi:hypothetical protein
MGTIASDGLRRAYDRAATGDLDPLVALFGAELEWRDVERGHLLWRRAPS